MDPTIAQIAFLGGSSLIQGLGALFQSSNVNSLFAANNPAQAAMQMQTEAYQAEADLQSKQAQQALIDANNAMMVRSREIKFTRESQAYAFDQNGVLLSDTPMKVLNQTVQYGREEINAMAQRGQALAALSRMGAYITQSTGAARLFGEQSDFLTNMAKARIYDSQTKFGLFSGALSNLTRSAASAIPFLPWFGGVPQSSSGKLISPLTAQAGVWTGGGAPVPGNGSIDPFAQFNDPLGLRGFIGY